MQAEPITHSTTHYRFTVKLEDDTLLLQVNTKGTKDREVVARKRYVYEDLPKKIQVFGNIGEVFKYFRNSENFEISPQSATMTVFVYSLKDFKPVREAVPLSLENLKIRIEA